MEDENVIRPCLEDTICALEERFLQHFKFRELKTLRLVNKTIYNVCNEHINKDRKITVNVTYLNSDDLWRTDRYSKLKASAVSLKFSYLMESYLTVPNQFHNITKFLLNLSVGGHFNGFEDFFRQLPNLSYFGFSFSTLTCSCIKPDWWVTNHVYPNLKELEIVGEAQYPAAYFNFYPMIRFIKKHSSIKTLRIDHTIMSRIHNDLLDQKIKFESIYLYWNYYFLLFQNPTFYRPGLSHFEIWRLRKLYKNIYFQFTRDVPTSKLNTVATIYENRKMFGLKQVGKKCNRCNNFLVVNITDSNVVMPHVLYDVSSWFGLKDE